MKMLSSVKYTSCTDDDALRCDAEIVSYRIVVNGKMLYAMTWYDGLVRLRMTRSEMGCDSMKEMG